MKILSCEFTIDTACVELRYSDGTMISIDCTAVENEVPIICTSGQNWTGCSTMLRWNTPI